MKKQCRHLFLSLLILCLFAMVQGKTCVASAQSKASSPTISSLKEETVPVALLQKKAATGRWKKEAGRKYYLLPDDTRAVGSRKIKGTYYIFDADGWLCTPKKASLVTVGDKTYYVNKHGRPIPGWHVVKKKLYYVKKSGALKRGQKYQGITLTEDGSAKAGKLTTYQKKVSKVVDSITDESMSKSQKLRACWKYITSKSRFRYRLTDPNMKKKWWDKQSAYEILSRQSGDCYNFACAFAAMANDIGYTSYVVFGRVSGSRDHAADGLTRHAWVEIGGDYYDPEAQFAGWYKDCYDESYYAIRHQILKVIRYSDAKKR